MSINSVQPPFKVITDVDGDPLEDGYVYIGEPNLNPETNPINTYWDIALTVPAAQPIRTIGGYLSQSGAPGAIYVQGDYSITVRDKKTALVYTSPVGTGVLSSINSLVQVSDLVGYTPATDNTTVDVLGYYAVNDGGGGLFNWDSSINKNTGNGGTIVDPSVSLANQGTGVGSGCWMRQFDGALDVKWFGAKGDGSTDDTTAINTAITTGEIYIPEGTFLSDRATQVTYRGDGVVKTVALAFNRDFINLFSGDTEKKVIPLACAIRQDTAGSGWYLIDDANHEPNGIASIALSGSDLLLTYSFAATNISSLVVVTDETFASFGITCGPSVGKTSATIKLYKDLYATLNNVSLAVTHSPYFGTSVSAVDNADGTITVTHDSTGSNLQPPILMPTAGALAVPMLISVDADKFTYGMYAPLSGYIAYNGATWVVTTDAETKPTMVFASNKLTVTHETVSQGHATATARDGVTSQYIARMGGFSTTTFEVSFRDFAGAIITTPDTDMRFYFNMADLVLQETPTGGIRFVREKVNLDANDVFLSSANFWINGTMEV